MKLISTIGDPNGVGLECLYKALEYLILNVTEFEDIELTVAGNEELIRSYYKQLGISNAVVAGKIVVAGRKFNIANLDEIAPISFGNISKQAGEAAASSIEYSTTDVICGNSDAMLTMPISKEAIRLAGRNFPGHTEMIASACSVRSPLMILFHENMRVGLVSIHSPLADVHFEVTCSKIVSIGTTLNHSLKKDFAIQQPAIAILGLNPHSGENGNIGREELEIIIPAIEKLKLRGVNAFGPFAADGFFGFGEYKKYDAILAMYHDQGLIPLKLLAGGDGVNFTAGLPIIRTSPDHGTAFTIAGVNQANPKSTISAILAAYSIYKNRTAFDSEL